MTGDVFSERDDAATPLDDSEKTGLIPAWISFRHELNAAEQENILAAEQWAATSRKRDVLTENFIRQLHRRMFGNVWAWAGQFRTTARNIGVEAWQIGPELKVLLDDARYWVTHGTYIPDEIAARFHHRLVWIHPFPNGNGRLARLATDLLLVNLGCCRFSWGRASLAECSGIRQHYVDALRAADGGNLRPLLAFVRS